jgi:hypothetical protein
LYHSHRDKAIDEFVSRISSICGGEPGGPDSAEASCRLVMWVYEGLGPDRTVDPFGGAELLWRVDGSTAGELLSVTYDEGEEQTEEIEAGMD